MGNLSLLIPKESLIFWQQWHVTDISDNLTILRDKPVIDRVFQRTATDGPWSRTTSYPPRHLAYVLALCVCLTIKQFSSKALSTNILLCHLVFCTQTVCRPKWHPCSLCSVLLMTRGGLWSKVVHEIGNRVLFQTVVCSLVDEEGKRHKPGDILTRQQRTGVSHPCSKGKWFSSKKKFKKHVFIVM